MRPTLRRNGKHMVTVRTEHRLDGDQVAMLLATQCWSSLALDREDESEPVRDLGKGEAETAIRDQLWDAGTHKLEFFGERLENDAAEAVAWAVRQVQLHWPEMETTIGKMEW